MYSMEQTETHSTATTDKAYLRNDMMKESLVEKKSNKKGFQSQVINQ